MELKCAICKQGINGTYYSDEWGNNVCYKHTIKYCDSCNRIITTTIPKPVNKRYYCAHCQSIAVNTSTSTANLYKNILGIYNKYTIKNVPETVPIHIVDKTTLIAPSNAVNTTDVLGLAVTNTHWSSLSTRKTFEHTIYILGGLPMIEFEAVLAHELLHTWLNQYEIKMTDPETEGFCNLGSYLVLTLNATKHAQILMKKKKDDKSEVYGAGFRKMLAEVQQKGWARFLSDVRSRK